MNRYLLCTNFVLYVIKNRMLEVVQTFNVNGGRMAISNITIAALFHGGEKCTLRRKSDADRCFHNAPDVPSCTPKAAHITA